MLPILRRWPTITIGVLIAVLAGCGYSTKSNEREILGILESRFPEARWGVTCVDYGGADSNPHCGVGFELRRPVNPTIAELFAFARRTEIDANEDGRIIHLHYGGMSAARSDAQGALHQVEVVCPGNPAKTGELSFSSAQITRDGEAAAMIKRFGCHLMVIGNPYSTVGK